ncbi:type II toxin-antitoxin system PemK/MazF family toxin [Hymenobacter saemangeumensis]|uniref:mRNA interferase n=1 Tax=Hymenobacter saemangeumensis TaxID=1084522 RepID=A0ABP8IKZ1_9BACT
MVSAAYPRRFEVWLVTLDPTLGSEIAKTRPCVVVSPDAANKFLRTVLVAPLTHTQKRYPTRVNCTFQQQPGQVALDQLRAVDTVRLVKHLGELEEATGREVCAVLGEMFAW